MGSLNRPFNELNEPVAQECGPSGSEYQSRDQGCGRPNPLKEGNEVRNLA